MSTLNTISTSEQIIEPAAIQLQVHHLRFTMRAETTILFNEFKGSALRGALAACLRRNFCPEWRAEQTDPLHQSLCPVCQLLSWEGDAGIAGDIRRPYAIELPPDEGNQFAAGETFTFGLVLYGDKLAYLPYLVLGIDNMGKVGVGRRHADGQRGRFSILEIQAVNQFSAETATMMAAGERMVRANTLPITHEQIMEQSARLAKTLGAAGNHLQVHFQTPARINQGEHMLKTPAFFPFAKQVVLRLLDLCAQHGSGRPNVVLKREHLSSRQPGAVGRKPYPLVGSSRLFEPVTTITNVRRSGGYSRLLDARSGGRCCLGCCGDKAPMSAKTLSKAAACSEYRP